MLLINGYRGYMGYKGYKGYTRFGTVAGLHPR